jgi:hypothetical protein
MKPLILIFVLTNSACVCGQDTIPATEEDPILQKIDFGQPCNASSYTSMLQKLRDEPVDSLVITNCLYYYRGEPFTGVFRTTLTDSIYTLDHCIDGRPDGAQLTLKRSSDGSFKRACICYPIDDSGERIAYETFYPSGQLKIRGCRFSSYCRGFEALFGSLGPDCDYREYYENGQLKEYSTIRYGEYDGVRELYYANGQLREHQEYSFRQPRGKWLQYAESGELTGKARFKGEKARGFWDGKPVRK